jgi:hypothetical protein
LYHTNKYLCILKRGLASFSDAKLTFAVGLAPPVPQARAGGALVRAILMLIIRPLLAKPGKEHDNYRFICFIQ